MSSNDEDQKGLLVIFSAPSGCGKTTVVERLLKRHPDWVRSISATTRPPRSGETDGEDYYFIDDENFKDMTARGDFLEYAEVHGAHYGTPKAAVLDEVEKGNTVILAIDVQGMKKVKDVLFGKVPMISVFLLPPSLKILRERLEGRKTDAPEQIEKRLQAAEEEIKEANLYDVAIVNQNVEQTVSEIDEAILKGQKERI